MKKGKNLLREFKNLRQEEKTKRRLFTDNFFDLYFWFEKQTDKIIGFQLIYSVNRKQMAFTYDINDKPQIQIVDDNNESIFNPSPILDGPGIFLREELISEFNKRSIQIEDRLRNMVLNQLNSFTP